LIEPENGTPTQAKKEGRGANCKLKHQDVRCIYKVVLNLPASLAVCEQQRCTIFRATPKAGHARLAQQDWQALQALETPTGLHLLADWTASISLP
jgi:hypothetical protein